MVFRISWYILLILLGILCEEHINEFPALCQYICQKSQNEILQIDN